MRLSKPSHARKWQAECLQLCDDEDLKLYGIGSVAWNSPSKPIRSLALKLRENPAENGRR
jgi:hypothetical protein